MNEALLILGMTAVTFGVRYGIVALLGRVELPKPIFRALRYVPPAVLTAIIIPEVLYKGEGGSLFISAHNSFLVAAVFTAFVSWWTKHLLVTIVLGMAFFLLWRAQFGA